jgi:hypothetical protein
MTVLILPLLHHSYHNMELALESMESQRAVMYNPSTSSYFLQYTDGHGNKNGTIYNERQEPGDQFFWWVPRRCREHRSCHDPPVYECRDYRVPQAAQYYIKSVLNTTTYTPYVDGTFTDGAYRRCPPEVAARVQHAPCASLPVLHFCRRHGPAGFVCAGFPSFPALFLRRPLRKVFHSIDDAPCN